jgi:hypothetical protein
LHGSRRRFGHLDQLGPLQITGEIERNRIAATGTNLLVAINLCNGSDRRIRAYKKRLLHETIGLRELDRSGALGVVGDEADVRLSLLYSVDHGLRTRHSVDRHLNAKATSELPREIDDRTARSPG